MQFSNILAQDQESISTPHKDRTRIESVVKAFLQGRYNENLYWTSVLRALGSHIILHCPGEMLNFEAKPARV